MNDKKENRSLNDGDVTTGWQAATGQRGQLRPAAHGVWGAVIAELQKGAAERLNKLLKKAEGPRLKAKGPSRTGHSSDNAEGHIKSQERGTARGDSRPTEICGAGRREDRKVRRSQTAATEGRESSGVAEQQPAFSQSASPRHEEQEITSSEKEFTSNHIRNSQEKAGIHMKTQEATTSNWSKDEGRKSKDRVEGEVRGTSEMRSAEGDFSIAQVSADNAQLSSTISLDGEREGELGILDFESGRRMGKVRGMKILTLGHSPDPDDAFMFYGLAKELIPSQGFRFEHILQDIQTLNERATRGELDISAVSIHAYAYVCDQYALLPSGASMGDGYGPMLVAKHKFSREEIAGKRIAVPGTMTSAFLALQLWLGKSAKEFNYIVVPFDEIFRAVREGKAEVGLIIHEGQLTYANEGLVVCEDLGVWWGKENGGLPLPLGGNVIHKRHDAATRKVISDILTGSIQFSLDHRAEAVAHALQYARDMGKDLADKFVGMYVNHWTLDYGEKGRESIRRFLKLAHERGLIPRAPELEFVK